MTGKEPDELKKTTVSDRDETRIVPTVVPGAAAHDLSAEDVEKIMKEVGKKRDAEKKKKVVGKQVEVRKKKRELPDDRLPSEVTSGDDDTTVFMPAIDPDAIKGMDEDGDEEMATVVFQAVDPNVFKKELTDEELEQIVNEVGKDNPKAVDDRLPSEVTPDDDEEKKS